MVERQSIKGRDVWLRVDTYHVPRANPNIIPTEYFTASYYMQEPASGAEGEVIREDNGEAKLFESPVAALSFARKRLKGMI